MSTGTTNNPPPLLDDAFLDWLRDTTERRWATQPTPTLEQFESDGCGGPAFQQGTRWSGGLTEAEISAIEERLSLPFPPDYRLFLSRLHTTDRPLVGAQVLSDGRWELALYWEITNWIVDENPINSARSLLVDGFAFDVEMNGLWKPAWGERPETEAGRRKRLAEVIAAAPRLIPIFAGRYLLGDPCRTGNPVLSIYQSDIIAYGINFREYLAFAFGRTPRAEFMRGHEAAQRIPFWGEFVLSARS